MVEPSCILLFISSVRRISRQRYFLMVPRTLPYNGYNTLYQLSDDGPKVRIVCPLIKTTKVQYRKNSRESITRSQNREAVAVQYSFLNFLKEQQTNSSQNYEMESDDSSFKHFQICAFQYLRSRDFGAARLCFDAALKGKSDDGGSCSVLLKSSLNAFDASSSCSYRLRQGNGIDCTVKVTPCDEDVLLIFENNRGQTCILFDTLTKSLSLDSLQCTARTVFNIATCYFWEGLHEWDDHKSEYFLKTAVKFYELASQLIFQRQEGGSAEETSPLLVMAAQNSLGFIHQLRGEKMKAETSFADLFTWLEYFTTNDSDFRLSDDLRRIFLNNVFQRAAICNTAAAA